MTANGGTERRTARRDSARFTYALEGIAAQRSDLRIFRNVFVTYCGRGCCLNDVPRLVFLSNRPENHNQAKVLAMALGPGVSVFVVAEDTVVDFDTGHVALDLVFADGSRERTPRMTALQFAVLVHRFRHSGCTAWQPAVEDIAPLAEPLARAEWLHQGASPGAPEPRREYGFGATDPDVRLSQLLYVSPRPAQNVDIDAVLVYYAGHRQLGIDVLEESVLPMDDKELRPVRSLVRHVPGSTAWHITTPRGAENRWDDSGYVHRFDADAYTECASEAHWPRYDGLISWMRARYGVDLPALTNPLPDDEDTASLAPDTVWVSSFTDVSTGPADARRRERIWSWTRDGVPAWSLNTGSLPDIAA